MDDTVSHAEHHLPPLHLRLGRGGGVEELLELLREERRKTRGKRRGGSDSGSSSVSVQKPERIQVQVGVGMVEVVGMVGVGYFVEGLGPQGPIVHRGEQLAVAAWVEVQSRQSPCHYLVHQVDHALAV